MKFENNKKKGFTLIELIVVIVIMISILILSIVSVNNISKKNKDKAWQKVKDGVIVAAKEYYEINAYELAGLDGEDSSTETQKIAKISVGKLVDEDYLNIVTNPVTGLKVNKCDYVEIKINGDKYSYEYKEQNETINCNIQHEIIISEIGAPSLELDFINNDIRNGYFIKKEAKARATVNTNGHGSIAKVSYKTTGMDEYKEIELIKANNGAGDYFADTVEGNANIIEFTAENISGNKVSVKREYKKDTVIPECGLSKSSIAGWTNQNKTITQECKDTTSGCMHDEYSQTFNSTLRTGQIAIEDRAGNTNTCDVDVLVDKTPPACGDNNGSTAWTNQDRQITQNCIDADSGCSSVTRKYTKSLKTDKITISDNVGNTNSCDVNVYVDKEKPKCSIAFSGTKGWNGWYVTKDVNVSMTKEDTANKNGVKSGIGEFGLTTQDTVTYNDSATNVQKNRTNGTTWYGYVKDNAGNVNDCSKTVKLEKNVTISFDEKSTNKSTSVNPDNNSDGKKVFNPSFSTCGYGTCSNINCYTDSDKKNQCQTEYFARSCMYVKTYARYFKVSSASTGNNKKVQVVDLVDDDYNNDETPGMKRIKDVNRYSCQDEWDSKYYFNNCGNKDGTGRNDFSAHVYQYITESGLGSNKIRLYTEYAIDCKY